MCIWVILLKNITYNGYFKYTILISSEIQI